MAFNSGNQQFDFLMSRARNRRQTMNALKNNNIDVQTSQEKMEESESVDTTTVGNKVTDISGLGASGVSVTGPSQSIVDAQEMMDIAGVGTGQTVGQVAFETEKDRAKADFAQSNPVGAAIAGFSTDAVAQGVVQTAPLGLAMAGKMEAARAAANVANVVGGPAFGMISGVIGPTMQDPYGQNVAMGSGLLGQVSNSLMSAHYSVAEQVAKGTPGYAQGYYGGSLLSVEPGIFGGLTYTGVNVPNIDQYSPSQFMADIEEQKAYAEEVEPFGGMGSTSVISDPSTISVDTFGSPTEAAQAGVGYSSYDAQGNPTGAAPAGSQYSATGVFSSGDDNSDPNSSDMGYGFNDGGKVGMQMGGDPAQQQAPSTEMGFIGGPPDQFTEQQTIADDIPKEVPEGTFVINAPAVEFAGKKDIKQMLIEAYEIVAQADTDAGTDRTAQASKVPSKEQVEIMISRGEVVVPPEIAKVIGYDRLEKINNRGKREVARRQEESEQQEKPQARQVAEGGFIGMRDGGVTEDRRLPKKFDQNIADFLGVFDDAEDARINSRLYADTYKPRDDDKTEDMVRHILGSGYMADNMLGSFGFDYKEEAYRPLGKLYDKAYKFVTGKDPFVPDYDKTIRKESNIDLNNNEYGRLLRKKYADKKEFTKQVFLIGSSMAKGEDPSKFTIDGVQPQLSLGSEILDKAGSDKDIAIRQTLEKGAKEGAFDPFADYNMQGDLQN
jgi:hypothetical protein